MFIRLMQPHIGVVFHFLVLRSAIVGVTLPLLRRFRVVTGGDLIIRPVAAIDPLTYGDTCVHFRL